VIGDGVGHGVEVVDEARVGDVDIFRTEEGGHEFVDDKGVLGGDEGSIGVEEGVAEEFDDFVRAVAEDDVVEI